MFERHPFVPIRSKKFFDVVRRYCSDQEKVTKVTKVTLVTSSSDFNNYSDSDIAQKTLDVDVTDVTFVTVGEELVVDD